MTSSRRFIDGVGLDAAVATHISPRSLADLPFDFVRYVQVEPRLRSAQWLTGDGPQAGAQAEVVAEIPYTVPLVRSLLGTPRALVTVIDWSPPDHASITFDGHRFEGWADINLDERDRGCVVRIHGVVRARSRLASLLLRPLEPQLGRLATRAIARGVLRASESLIV